MTETCEAKKHVRPTRATLTRPRPSLTRAPVVHRVHNTVHTLVPPPLHIWYKCSQHPDYCILAEMPYRALGQTCTLLEVRIGTRVMFEYGNEMTTQRKLAWCSKLIRLDHSKLVRSEFARHKCRPFPENKPTCVLAHHIPWARAASTPGTCTSTISGMAQSGPCPP
jgi:hypothetical protein